MRPRRSAGERGVATVWAVVLISVLSMVTFVVVGLTGAIGARHRAESAADLAALAAAVSGRDGGDACAAAEAVARANSGALVGCTTRDSVVEVSVQVATPVLWGTTWEQVGVARAGPADGT